MPIRHDPALEAANLRPGHQVTYELQNVTGSPTRRFPLKNSHFTDYENALDEAEKTIFEHIDFDSDSDYATTSPQSLHYTPSEEEAVMFGPWLIRSDIGNAKIAGLSADLHLNSSQYEWTLRSFYITYVLFEWMPILYTVLSPSTYIASCVAAWGIIASLQAVATSYKVLCVLRALLGISEAAFSPGVPVFLAFFYKRNELAYRIGLFISAAPLATSFASSLAWLITMLGHKSPIASWRMLFLVEGFPSVFISMLAYYHIPNRPGVAKYLTKRERRVAELRLRAKKRDDHQHEARSRKFEWNEIWEALRDPQCYLTAYRNRSIFICFHALLAAAGYTMITIAGILKANPMWRYWGVYPAASGFFSAVTLLITWTINNQESDAKKGTGVVILNIIGQLGPFIGTALYPEDDQPYYSRGMAACTVFMLVVAALSLWLRRFLQNKNIERDAMCSIAEGEEEEDLALHNDSRKLVDQPRGFHYIL
ncbi:MAG: hypothetical protein Q9196_005890 [Gyalolechia fulgens]